MHTRAPDISDVSHRLAELLLTYRSTPHTTTSRSSSKLFKGRTVWTRLDLILPSCQSQVLQRLSQQKKDHYRSSHIRELCTGQRVLARNYRNLKRWLPGMVAQKLGPLMYSVQLDSGLLWRRHTDQLWLLGDNARVTTKETTRPRSLCKWGYPHHLMLQSQINHHFKTWLNLLRTHLNLISCCHQMPQSIVIQLGTDISHSVSLLLWLIETVCFDSRSALDNFLGGCFV